MEYPNFTNHPITDRTQEDVENARKWYKGILLTKDLECLSGNLLDSDDEQLEVIFADDEYIGTLNYFDMNRIEDNIKECCRVMMGWGYPTRPYANIINNSMCSAGYVWRMDTIPYMSRIKTIRDNAKLIQTRLLKGVLNDEISYSNTLDYEDANLLENVAHMADVTLRGIGESAKHCADYDFYCGGGYV